MYTYFYDHVDEDGHRSNWRLLYEVEPPNAGDRDEPASGGVALIRQIQHQDGSKLPRDSWSAAGFGAILLEALEDLCYSYHREATESARDDEADRRMDERRERERGIGRCE